ncbi:MAG: hypothetical protein IT450_21595 [Phycisphaerales bacterium]|nr:hypothetical protein [Phycisphaerales bacterium]
MRRKRRWWRIVLVSLGCVLTLLLASAIYVTRPNVLRATVLNALDHPDFRVREMGDVVFAFPSTAIIDGLEVDRAGTPPLPDGKPRPPFLRVPRAKVELSAAALLLGTVRIVRLELQQPSVTLVGMLPKSAEIAPAPGGEAPAAPPAEFETPVEWSTFWTPGILPDISIRRANLQILNYVDDHLALARQWILDGEGRLAGGGGDGSRYDLTLQQVGGPVNRASRGGSGDEAIFHMSWSEEEISARLGFVECEALTGLVPAGWRDAVDALGLQGVAGIEEFILRRSGAQSVRLDLADVKLVLPVEESTVREPYIRLGIHSGEIALSADAASGGGGSREFDGDLKLNLRGDWRGAPVAVDAVARGVSLSPLPGRRRIELAGREWFVRTIELQAEIDALDLPTAASYPEFLHSHRLPDALRAFFEDYEPTGAATIRFHAHLDAADPEVHYAGEFQPLGGTVRYFRFPYTASDVRGSIRFSPQGTELVDMTGHHGQTQIWGGGKIDSTDPRTGFDVTFFTRNLTFDRDLYTALPEEYQRLWQKADPVGLTDSRVRVYRPDAVGQERSARPTIEIDSNVVAAALTLAPGERLEDAAGVIRVRDGGMVIEGLTGLLNGSRTLVRGTVEPRADGDPSERFQFESRAAAFERRLSLEGSGGPALVFRGEAEVWGQHTTSPAGAARSYSARITSGTLLGFDDATSWSVDRGLVSIDDNLQRIDHLALSRPGGSLALSGATVSAADGAVETGTIDIAITDADFAAALRGLIPAAWGRTRDDLGLSGAGGLKAILEIDRDVAGGYSIRADGAVTAAKMNPNLLPLDFQKVEAQARIEPGLLNVRRFEARVGDAAIRGTATAGWTDADSWFEIRAEAEPVALDETLLRSLPEGLSAVLRRLDARGRIAVTLEPATLVSRVRNDWQVAGRVGFTDGHLAIGLNLAALKGDLSGRCGISQGEVEIDADFALDSGTIDGRDIRNWVGRLTRRAGERIVSIGLESGETCGGRIAGDARIDPESGEYELSLVLSGLLLDRFIGEPSGDDKPRAGLLDGRIFLRGRGEDPLLRVGGGDLRIRGASLMSSPVTKSIAEESRRKNRPIGEELDEVSLQFVWERDELVFNRVVFTSRELRLVGVGRWNMSTDALTLTLEGATGEDAARIAVLSDFLESVSREVAQYRVTGTSANPRVTVEWMHNFTEPVRRLLSGDGRQR